MPEPPQTAKASHYEYAKGLEDKELLPSSQLQHEGKCQYTTAITTMWLESS